MAWIDKIPLGTLLFLSLIFGLAPFFPEPHLVEKLKMLFSFKLVKPIDIFDLIMHATPLILLIVKIIRLIILKNK